MEITSLSGGGHPTLRPRAPLETLESMAVITRYHRGQEIYGHEDPPEYWYRIVSGVGRWFAIHPNGQRQLLDFLLPGDFFGLAARYAHRFAVEAAVDDTVVAGYPRRQVEMLARADAGLERDIHAAAAREIGRFQVVRGDRGEPDAPSEITERANAAVEQAAGRAAELAVALEKERALAALKDMHIREIHHRVSNGLQIVLSLMHIQAGREESSNTLDTLHLACSRIEAIAKVHAMLQTGDAPDRLDVAAYLGKLCVSLGDALGADGYHRTLVVEAESTTLPIATAQALGLIVTELVTNAFRHAFGTHGPGTVWIQISPTTGGGLKLSVADDGRGLPAQILRGAGPGLGLRIVAMMAKQLGAWLDVTYRNGTRITVTLPCPEPQGSSQADD